MRTPAVTICILVAVALLGAGCGRKGVPRPREDVLPATVIDLKADNSAAGIELTWSRPKHYSGGGRMNDLSAFVLERAVGTDEASPFSVLGRVEVTDRERFQQQGRFRIVDTHTIVGEQYRYRVVSFTTDEYVSDPSNTVTVERKPAAEETHAPLPATPR